MEKNIITLEAGNSPNSRGLFSFVNQFLAACFFYDKNEQIHVTFDLIKKSSYYDSSIIYEDNVWFYFFVRKDIKPLSEKKIVWTEVKNKYGYDFNFNNSEEREVAEIIINKYLNIKPSIEQKINFFYKNNFKGKKVLGVHKRGTDIGIHFEKKNIEIYYQEIDKIIHDYDAIFLCTDQKIVVDEFKKKYDKVIHYSYDSLSTDEKPSFKSSSKDKFKNGEDAIIDAFLLSKCNFLIQTNSNLSNFSLLANSKLKFKRII